MTQHKLLSATVMKFYKKSEHDGVWICLLCQNDKKRITQKKSTGYTNLKNHLMNVHPNHNEFVPMQGNLKDYIKPKSSNIYGWLRKIIYNCQPISLVENEIELEYTTLKPISRKTIKNAINMLFIEVKREISKCLPDLFCICFDGWTENNTHFLGIFAFFNDQNNVPGRVLLGFTTLIDETNWSAQNQADTILLVLEDYNKSIHNVVCLIGDNCNVNKKIADLFWLPLIGCASHKLNLAIQSYLKDFVEVGLIDQLMKKLSTPLKLAQLRKFTTLKPIRRNITRWGSCFEMIKRYLELKDYIDMADPELAELMPSPIQVLNLNELFKEMEPLHELSVYLQTSTLNISTVRNCFNKVIEKHQTMNKYLKIDASITHSPLFEKSLVMIMSGQEDHMSEDEKSVVQNLLLGNQENNIVTIATLNPFINSNSELMSKSKYINLNFIQPTSNVVERLFSLAKRIYAYDRKSLGNSTLEDIMFLNQNKDYWDESVVDMIIK